MNFSSSFTINTEIPKTSVSNVYHQSNILFVFTYFFFINRHNYAIILLIIFIQGAESIYTYPEKEKIAVVNRYLNGETISKISQSTKISRTTIYLWIKERNNSFNKGKAPNSRYLHDLQEKCDRQQKIIEILQRSPCTPSAPLSKRYEVIKSLSDEYTVNILCEALKVAKGSYYNHILRDKNGNTKAANRKAEMLPVIDQIFHDYNEFFGSSKIYAILKDRGYAISETTVAKIMHNNGLFSIRACAKTLYKQQLERKTIFFNNNFTFLILMKFG